MKLAEIAAFITEALDFNTLKKNKVALKPEEREEAMKAGAVWHHGPHGEETCAIWKSKTAGGKIVYGTNSHRCFQTAPTLKGAIKKYHDVVKDTA